MCEMHTEKACFDKCMHIYQYNDLTVPVTDIIDCLINVVHLVCDICPLQQDRVTWREGAMTDSVDRICYIMKVVLHAVSVFRHQMEADDLIFSDGQIEAPAYFGVSEENWSPVYIFHIPYFSYRI